ncbi:hypothetical protein [Caballeronia sordidicola]|nr:hypothetical protein [Caballeronia sordidicola]
MSTRSLLDAANQELLQFFLDLGMSTPYALGAGVACISSMN